MNVGMPVTFILLRELIGRDTAGNLGPLTRSLTLERIASALIQAPVSRSEVVKAFPEVWTILHGQSHESGDSGAIGGHCGFHLWQILSNKLPRSAHGTERAEQVLLAGGCFDQAQLVNSEVIMEDQVRSALVQVGIDLLKVRSFLGFAEAVNVPGHVHGPCFSGSVVGYNFHVRSLNPVGVGAPIIGVFLFL